MSKNKKKMDKEIKDEDILFGDEVDKVDKPKKVKKIENVEKVKEVKKVEEVEKVSFDAYFSMMKSLDSKIKEHHKKPMEVFLKEKGFKDLMGTKEEFKKVLKGY